MAGKCTKQVVFGAVGIKSRGMPVRDVAGVPSRGGASKCRL